MVDDPTMASPSLDLEPKHVFGLTTGVTGNCLYLNDHVIVYPASGVIVVRDTRSGRQKFIRLTACRKIVTAMDLNAINHVLAVATVDDGTAAEDDESYGQSPIVSVYDLKSTDLKYVFAEPAATGDGPRRFASVRFLYDNVLVAALAVGPGGRDAVVYYYSWRNSTVETRVTVDGNVAEVALNPIDTTICCFVGNELFRLMTKTEKEWSQYGFREANGIDFTCVCWLCGDRCLAGTSDGRVVLFKNGVLQAAYRPEEVDDFDVTVKSENERLSTTAESTESGPPPQPVRSCFTTQSGLVILVGGSTIYYFRKTDEGRKYVKDGVYVKSEDRYLQSPGIKGERPIHFVESVCVSPDGETLICVTKRAQLYSAPLSRLDENDNESFNSPIEIKPLGEELHYGGVQSLSTSFWKPVLMTCGKIDYTIKVWNYLDGTLLLSKHYPKQVNSVSMHPTGLYSVVAFMDHVEFFMLHVDDLVTLKYFSVRDCGVTAFSEAGHMFALAKMDAIDVYCSVLFEKRLSCRNHMANIETLVWSNNDKNIVVYDVVGAICSFETKTGKVYSHIAPYSGVAYTDLTVAENADRMFVTAEDGALREILERKVVREVNFHQGSLNAVSVSKSNSMLFLAAQNGVVLTVALPLMYQVVRKEFKMFNQSITKLCLAMDGSALISCSKDGSLCIWEVKDVVHNMQKSENRYSDDVLVNWSKLETIIGNTKKVEKEVTKLKTECTQTINKFKAAKDQDLQDTKNANSADYKDAFVKIKEIGEMQSDTERKLEAELTALKQINDLRIASLDAKYGEKLAYKYEKNSKLEDKAFATIAESTKELESLKEKLNKELHEAMADYEEKLKNKDEEIFKRKEKLVKEKDVLKMLAGDTEHDVDDNVMNTRNKFIFKLKKLKELHVKCMGELAEHKMKHNLYSRTTADLKNQAGILEADVEKLKQSANAKQETISNLNRSLKMCNERIPIKEREIQGVQDDMRELNKELGVLTASIVGLEQATQPLILRIQEQKNLYEENEVELDKELKSLKRLELSFDELKAEKESKDQEFGRLTQVVEGAYEEFNRILTNMRVTVQYNSRKRDDEKAIKKFFSKYVGENAVYKTSRDEIDARIEFNRQRQFLQRSIDGLEKTLKSLEVKNESHHLIMEENSKLIEEIDGFRKDANTYLNKYNSLKHLLVVPKADSENRLLSN